MENVRELNLEQMEKVSGGVEYPVHTERLILCSKCGELHFIDEPCIFHRLEDITRMLEEKDTGLNIPRDGSPGPNVSIDSGLTIKPDEDLVIPIPEIKIPLL